MSRCLIDLAAFLTEKAFAAGTMSSIWALGFSASLAPLLAKQGRAVK